MNQLQTTIFIKKLIFFFRLKMKIFILEQSFMTSANSLAEKLSKILNDFNGISKYVSTDPRSEYEKLKNEDFILAVKNNVMLFVESNKNEEFVGITLDDFYSSDIIPIKISEFNNIIDEYVKDNLIIWLDEKTNKQTLKKDISETTYLMERLNNLNLTYLYFFGESEEDIVNIIQRYVTGTEEEKNEIEIEYK